MDNRNRIILATFLILVFFTSCSSQQNLIGKYQSNKADHIQIVLENNNFLIIDKTDNSRLPFKCCDTISYGKWKKEKNGFLAFNSPERFNTYTLNMSVKENLIESGDSITVFIKNPIESHYVKFNEKYRELYYQLEISSTNTDFDVKLAQKKWETNYIKFLKPKGVTINSLTLNIVPKADMNIRNIQAKTITTLPFEVFEKKSNSFEIEVLGLTYQYISLLRLENDFVKVDNDALIWNEKKFIKE